MMLRAFLLGSLLLAGLSLAGCQSLSDVAPGDGRTATITGHTYEEIWRAALTVADEHFEIREQDQARGVIKAERTTTAFGWGAWVGLYITPPAPGANRYVVEVVSRKKATGNLAEQGWEGKVLHDLQDVLAGRPMR
jgi:hypothetical protein